MELFPEETAQKLQDLRGLLLGKVETSFSERRRCGRDEDYPKKSWPWSTRRAWRT